MIIVEQSATILAHTHDAEVLIERAGRTCYKSEDKATPGSAAKMVSALCKSGHESVLEHASATLLLVTNRAIANEIVRHRAGFSFSQESTRYVNYNKKGDIAVIRPIFKVGADRFWEVSVEDSCDFYNKMIEEGEPPEVARDVLPLCLKTEIVVTANFRAWRHFLRLRMLNSTGRSHPQIQQLSKMIAVELNNIAPTCFGEFVKDVTTIPIVVSYKHKQEY